MWILAFILLGLAKSYEVVYQKFNHSESQFLQYKAHRSINQLHTSLEQFDRRFLNLLSKQSYSDKQLTDQIIDYFAETESNYNFLLCNNVQLVFWNKPGVYFDPAWCP
ncbi:MAG: hypothetical protein M3Q56_03125, partial [Bacteroidota bacterium]|nr:hypothetical protein [Bacteroidota bacterium]